MHKHTVRATVNTGIVEGFTRDGVSSWRSIPYARPPLGRLRFRAPRPVEPWPGVRYCHGFAYCAPQERKYTLLGVGKFQPMSEDCLTLNVVASDSPDGGPPDGPLPVMVFIHGGAYFAGSSATPLYNGESVTSLTARSRQLLFTPRGCEGPVQPEGCCVRHVRRLLRCDRSVGRRIPLG